GRCLFCQNYPISQLGVGKPVTVQRLAGIMLELQRRGCHNVNLVTPTHFAPAILRATAVAAREGLRLPLVYNTSGYDSLETLALLDGVVDVYLPDAKYACNTTARDLSGFPAYVETNRAAIVEMARQVGPSLALDEAGIAYRGLAIRHMVLPRDLSQTAAVLDWVAGALGPRVDVSLMAQYFPAHRAVGHAVLGRKITVEEWEAALAALDAAGLENGWVQEPFEDTDHEEVAGWERARHNEA
ncbi:MAG: radical SAM protein, partial [Anaerolineae bacterium]